MQITFSSKEHPMQSRNWVHVARLDDTIGSPIRTSTGYKWHHLKRFPQLFRHVGGKLFIDMDKLFQMAEAGKLR
jgi:hypothetical protein